MTYYADLHSHSTASDGSDSPTHVVERAKAVGLKVMALTDHDTVGGIEEARAAGERLGVRVVAGTELSCYMNGKGIHVLGLGLDIKNARLLEHCAKFQEARIERAEQIGKKLAELGVPVDMEKVMAKADDGVIGRPHVAEALIEAGHVSNRQQAFDQFLADGRPAYIPKMNVSPKEVVEIISEAGGIAIMAHPGLGPRIEYIDHLIEVGALGIEVWHSSHDKTMVDKLHVYATDRGLLKTGGSDCHGGNKDMGPILGKFGLQQAGWDKVEKAMLAAAS